MLVLGATPKKKEDPPLSQLDVDATPESQLDADATPERVSPLSQLDMGVILIIASFLKPDPVVSTWRHFDRQASVFDEEGREITPTYMPYHEGPLPDWKEINSWSIPVCLGLPEFWLEMWSPYMPYESRPDPPTIHSILEWDEWQAQFSIGSTKYDLGEYMEEIYVPDEDIWEGSGGVAPSYYLLMSCPFATLFVRVTDGENPDYWELHIQTVAGTRRAFARLTEIEEDDSA